MEITYMNPWVLASLHWFWNPRVWYGNEAKKVIPIQLIRSYPTEWV